MAFNFDQDIIAACAGLKCVQGERKSPLLEMQDVTCRKISVRIYNVGVKMVSGYW
jgi:hypothetical protein